MRAGAGDLHPIAARFINIKEEGLLDCVLVRTGFDEHAVLQKDIGGAQNVLAAIERISDVMEAALGAGVVARIGEVVALVRGGHPHAGFAAVVEYDLFGEAEAEIVLEELAVGLDVDGEPVEMMDA